MSDYYSIPTNLGEAKLAAAANNSQALTLSHMAFGDANGAPYLPTARVGETQLLNERYRVAVQFVTQDSLNPNVYIIKARIPANIGGFDINEIGIFDTNGELIYLANYPRTFKPQITQGAGGELTIKLHIITSYSSAISIILDPNVITLTQDEGDNRYALKMELASETQSRVDADNNEATTRENDDMALAISLAAEATTRENDDMALAISLAAEITNRENEDNNLIREILNKSWPIGSVYENAVDLRNPTHADLLGFGTWVPYAVGLTTVGLKDSDADFGAIGETGGKKGHKMTLSNQIEHDHDRNPDGTEEYVNGGTADSTYPGNYSPGAYYLEKYTKTKKTGSADPEAIPTLMPYIVSAKWRRTE